MKSFNVVHYDGVVQVSIDDTGFAVLRVQGIKTDEVIVRAINQAVHNGAKKGTLFTDDYVNDRIARTQIMRAKKGITWLGGKVTQLEDGEEGPMFRIDWDVFPSITV